MLPVLVVPTPLPRRHVGASAGGVHPIITPVLQLETASGSQHRSDANGYDPTSTDATARPVRPSAGSGPSPSFTTSRPGRGPSPGVTITTTPGSFSGSTAPA